MAFIKLDRNIACSDIFSENDMLAVYIRLILAAKYMPAVDTGISLSRGQLSVSVRKYADSCGISYQRMRTILRTLEEAHFIEITGVKSRSIITVINYDCDDVFPVSATQPATQEQRTEQRSSNAASLLIERKKNLRMQEPRAQNQIFSDADARAELVRNFGEGNVAEYERRFEAWRAKQTRPVNVGRYDTIAKWLREDNVIKPAEPSFDSGGIMDELIAGYCGGV